jgi:hypothetical protein
MRNVSLPLPALAVRWRGEGGVRGRHASRSRFDLISFKESPH